MCFKRGCQTNDFLIIFSCVASVPIVGLELQDQDSHPDGMPITQVIFWERNKYYTSKTIFQKDSIQVSSAPSTSLKKLILPRCYRTHTCGKYIKSWLPSSSVQKSQFFCDSSSMGGTGSHFMHAKLNTSFKHIFSQIYFTIF